MSMTVKELREALVGLPDDMPVIIQQEGGVENGYSPLSSAEGDNQAYVEEETWCGTVKCQRLTEELRAKGFTNDDVAEGGVPCLVLCPVN